MAFQFNHNSDSLRTDGNPGYSFHLLSATTSNATVTPMAAKYADVISIPANVFVTYQGTVAAIEPSTGVWKVWQIAPQGAVSIGGLVSSLLGLSATTASNNNLATSGWSWTPTNDANNNLMINVTGQSGKTIKWGARLTILRIDMTA